MCINKYIKILEELIRCYLYVWWMRKKGRVNEDVYKGRVTNILGLVCGVRKDFLEEITFYLSLRWVGLQNRISAGESKNQ